MKNVFKIAFGAALLALSSLSLKAQNGNNCLSEGQAIAIARQACNVDVYPGGRWQAFETAATTPCEGGCTSQWAVWVVYTCHLPPSERPLCDPLPSVNVALVNQNCDGTIEVQCMN